MDEERICMVTSDFASLAYAIVLLVLAAAVVFTLYRIFTQAIRVVILWVLFGALLAAAYSYRSELRETGDWLLAELVPGHVVSRGRTVTVTRTGTGDFSIRAEINGARVAMVFDTGASSIVLTHDDAKAAGLPLELLDYTVNIDTANGRARAAKVTLDRVTIDSLVRALGGCARSTAGATANKPARHELSQPASKVGGEWRSPIPPRVSLTRIITIEARPRTRCITHNQGLY
jgi:predicted aspartyl protease